MTELERLLPGATRPYVGTAAFRELTGPQGEALPTRDRASCCMFYTLRPEDTCVTCPSHLRRGPRQQADGHGGHHRLTPAPAPGPLELNSLFSYGHSSSRGRSVG